MAFPIGPRPKRNRRTLAGVIAGDLPYDLDVEEAFYSTAGTDKAVRIPLARYHSSPAKGRLWACGWDIKNRRKGQFVDCWIEPKVLRGPDGEEIDVWVR